MFDFMSMLGGGKSGGGGQSGGRLGEAVGTKGSTMIQPSSNKIGMQYANMGLTPPDIPNMMNMLAGLQQLTQQQGGPKDLPTFLNMIRGG